MAAPPLRLPALHARLRAHPDALALAALTVLAAALRVACLSDQPLIPDDISVGDSALGYVATGWPGPTMWNHPRLRDLLVFGSVQIFGDGPWAIRSWSILLGTLSVPATFLMMRSLGVDRRPAAIAGLLLAFDPLHVGFSRQGINDVLLSFFSTAVVAAAWRYRTTRRVGWLILAGALLGLGLGSKWAIAFPAAVVAAVLLADALRAAAPWTDRSTEAAFVVACLVLLPLTLYLGTFAPWFGRGHDLAEWIRFQVRMAHETATHTGYPGTKLPGYLGEVVGAWRWFVQPVFYAEKAAEPVLRHGRLTIVAYAWISNPAAWLAVWPALAMTVRLAWRGRDAAGSALAALFLAAYLPFALAGRPIWTNSAPAVLPFAMALVGYAAERVWQRNRSLAASWLAVCLALGLALWFPAVGIGTGPTDRLTALFVPPEAFIK